METIHLTGSANQSSGFYIMIDLGFNELGIFRMLT